MATQSLRGPDGPRLATTREGVEYLIRPYERGDVADIVSLFTAHQTDKIDEEWFRQTYVENPYLDHVPLFVIEAEGDIVGVRPFTAFRIRAGNETELGLLHRDTLIHPEHRRRGLFTAMTELALEHYETATPAFMFGHSNPRSFPGYRKMGWSSLGHREVYTRVQEPGPLIAAKTRDAVTSVLSPTVTPLARLHLAVRDRTTSSSDDVTVTRHESVPEGTMASLYERRRPDELHVVRDEAFYRWRFRSSEWQPNTTYVARQDGEPVAGLITCRSDGNLSSVSVAGVVPRTGGERWEAAIASILGRIIADHEDVDILRVSEPVFPERILSARGFLSSGRRPLSLLVDEDRLLTLGVRPLGADEVRVNGRPIDEAAAELWSLTH